MSPSETKQASTLLKCIVRIIRKYVGKKCYSNITRNIKPATGKDEESRIQEKWHLSVVAMKQH